MEKKQYITTVNSLQMNLLNELTKATKKLEKCVTKNHESKGKNNPCTFEQDNLTVIAVTMGLSLKEQPHRFDLN